MIRHLHLRFFRPVVSPALLAALWLPVLLFSPPPVLAEEAQPGVIPPSERRQESPGVPVHLPKWLARSGNAPGDAEAPFRIDPLGEEPENEAWWPSFAPQRVGSTVLAATVFNGELIIGGDFVDASGQTAFHVARWSQSEWQPLGEGFNASVFDLTVFEDKLIAAGAFTQSGQDTLLHVAAWNGVSWQRLGDGLDDSVISVAEVDGKLYAGGYFHRSGPDKTEINGVAEWNGSTWNPLGNGVDGPDSHVNVVGAWNGDLVIGGLFSGADRNGIRNLARWDGTTFVDINGSVNDRVYDFTTTGSDLIVGGLFTEAGATAVRSVARYDGSEWSSIDGGMDSSILSLLAVGDSLYAGGLFSSAGGSTAISVARLDLAVPVAEEDWQSLGSGMDGGITRLVEWDGRVIAVGIFLLAGGETVNYVAQWDGTSWGPVGSEINGNVRAILADAPCTDCELVMAGDFTVAGGTRVNRITTWSRRDAQDPESWSWQALGDGFNGPVRTLVEYRGDLYAGGSFTFSDTLPEGGLARWTGESWEPLGDGLEGTINDATVWNDQLIVAGNISKIEGTQIASQVAAWDGTEFTAVGSTLSGSVNAVSVFHDSLFIGGTFRTSSFTPVPYLGKLVDGLWAAVGFGANDEVRALEVYDDQLFVGGIFTEMDSSAIPYLTAWDGQSFSGDVDNLSGEVETLHASTDFLHVGGDFSLETNMGSTRSVALYTPRAGWFRLGTGLDGKVLAIASFENDIYVGGEFFAAGGRPSPNVARFREGVPVPVQLSRFFGRRRGPDIEIQWRIDSSRNHAGFHLYRGDTSPQARITNALIREPTADGTYSFADRTAPVGITLYWLEEVSRDGASAFFGPIEVMASTFETQRSVVDFSSGPNPFRDQISLQFRAVRAGTFRGTIHDVQGRRVGELPELELLPGEHTVTWDGLTASGDSARPGVYFASLRFVLKDLARSRRPWTHTARLLKLR